jgi:fatty acid desaturase
VKSTKPLLPPAIRTRKRSLVKGPIGHSRGESAQTRWTHPQAHLLSRLVICAVVAASFGPLFLQISNPFLWVIDVLFRTYVMFLGTVMAHEGTHGHLGATKAANFWWGRLALLPTMVPFTNFRKTHQLHHAHTNIPDQDPDHFLKPRHAFELPLRAIAMPHQWFFWLRKRGRIKKGDVVELVLNYVGIFVVYGIMLALVDPSRLLWGMVPALILVSMLLWYPFAFKTHEGFATGSAEARSHNYYGRFMYWFSLGLSMHRQHHMQPKLTWIELKSYVEDMPVGSKLRFLPKRDIQTAAQSHEYAVN